jgi:NAD(P)-dependent dehydrogenase (short-subunit alcohol dehydrogenase family)
MGTRLQGRTVVVTGGARGLGAALAAGIASEGAAVCVADLDEDGAAATVAQLPVGLAVGADCATTAGILSVLDAVEREWRRPADGLVNNAGVISIGRLLELEDDEVDRVLRVNTAGPIRATREFARRLAAAEKGGSVVNVTSLAAHIASLPGLTAYAASKGGVRAFTHAAAADLARFGIRVNAIAPGWVQTEMSSSLAEDDHGLMARIPLRRPATPADLVGGAVYLLSDEAAYVTGTTLTIDGGWLAY